MSTLSFAVAGVALTVLAADGSAQSRIDVSASAALPSVTFPKLSTIYVASGVLSSGDPDNSGSATVVHCSNLGAAAADLRFIFHNNAGVVKGSHSFSLAARHTYTVATKGVNVFGDVAVGTGPIVQGRLLIQSTQSAVFCSAMLVDAAATVPEGIALHLVRFNAHPKTVE